MGAGLGAHSLASLSAAPACQWVTCCTLCASAYRFCLHLMSSSLLPLKLALPHAPAPYIAAHTRSCPCAHVLQQALQSLTGSDASAPLPSLAAAVLDPRGGGTVSRVALPLALPLGACFDALCAPAAAPADLPFALHAGALAAPAAASSPCGTAAVQEAFASNLRAATLLRHSAVPAAAEAAANAALPTARVLGALEEALHGGGGGGAAAAPAAPPRAAPAPLLVPLRLLLRAAESAGGGETLAVVQEGVAPGVTLLAALSGALARGAAYVPEARSVVLVEEGAPEASGTHCAVVHGAAAHAVPGMLGCALGELAAAAAMPDAWLYVSLRRSAGFGRVGL